MTTCDLEGCDGTAIAAWKRDEDGILRACEDCGDHLNSLEWD
jgi:hypothetical protein